MAVPAVAAISPATLVDVPTLVVSAWFVSAVVIYPITFTATHPVTVNAVYEAAPEWVIVFRTRLPPRFDNPVVN